MSETSPFREYVYVSNHSEDLNLLHRLHEVRLSQDQARELASDLCKEKGLRPVGFNWTARTDRAFYRWSSRAITIRPDQISTHILCHELAHHWIHTKFGHWNVPSRHGADFTDRLDLMAEAAWPKVSINRHEEMVRDD